MQFGRDASGANRFTTQEHCFCVDALRLQALLDRKLGRPSLRWEKGGAEARYKPRTAEHGRRDGAPKLMSFVLF